MLTDDDIDNRINLLFSCLIYSSERTEIFTTGERICINQERGALHDLKNRSIEYRRKKTVYKVPQSIEAKIDTCSQLMNRNASWESPTQEKYWETEII